MKRITILLFLCIGFFKTNAQITLTRADFPDSGDVFYTFNSPDSNLSVGSSGANVTWDFSQMNIDPAPQPVAFYWTQHISSTTTNQVGIGTGGITNQFYFLDNSVYKYVGQHSWFVQIGSTYDCTYYSDQKLLTFPFTYNNFFVDTFTEGGDCSNGSPPWSYTVIDSIVCDGYGTLILPFGTYDALRIYSGSGGQINSHYTWYTNNHKCPLLEAYYQSSTANYVFQLQNPSSTIGINENAVINQPITCIYSGTPGKYIIELNNSLKLFPANTFLSDLQGRKIIFTSNKISESKTEIDICNLSEGIYLLNVYGKGFNQTFKLVNNN